MTDIRVAEHAGFCFGVRRATGALEEEIERFRGTSRKIYTLGRIIHNDTYSAWLKEAGVGEISRADIDGIVERAEKGEEITVVIRAHGELNDIACRLKDCAEANPGFRLIDCTCPYVRKVRDICAQNSGEGMLFVLMGDAKHPEVEGIISCARGETRVVPDCAGLKALIEEMSKSDDCAKHINIAAQTTQNTSEWRNGVELAKRVCTNAGIFDTICSVTQQRQTEAEKLAEESDVMIVIGSSDSSNSRKLYDISSRKCDRVYFVRDASECPRLKDGDSRISITAGASTPDSVIQEVVRTMNEQNESFAELLESSFKSLNTGDIVEGTITAITPNEIHLDLGAKATGVIARDKATVDPNAKLDEIFKVGDVVKAKVIKVSDIDGIATLDKTTADAHVYWDKIQEAAESGEILEGKIVEVVKGGVLININSVKVFIPASLTGVPRDGDLNALAGTTQKVKIIEIKNDGGRKKPIASIKAVAYAEQKAKAAAFWENLAEGMEFDGEVKSFMDYGAFIDLGGVDGLVHSSELSWKRIRHPSDVLTIGEKIHVYVKSFDKEKGRISLGYKTEEMNPWYVFTNKYQEGDVAEVKIVNLLPFGAFAEIVPGCDGLIHISQIADHKIAKPDDVLTVGQVVNAKITAIDNEKKKVSLSIRALLNDAAEEAPADAE